MTEQIKMQEKKPVKICGVRQNCYVLDVNPTYSVTPLSPIKKYLSLERKTLDNGYIEELVEKDYPITPDSVASYADGADYRNDVMQAIENAPKRVNLGDISEAQEFINSDPLSAARQYKAILDKVDKYFKSQEQAAAAAAKSNQGGEVNNG